ncbi:MAG: SPASM domain-containing protein [Planctomycetota bacterium]
MKTVALIAVSKSRGQLGHPRSLDDRLGPCSVLEHTLRRVASIRDVQEVVLVAEDASSLDAPEAINGKPVLRHDAPHLGDAARARRRRVRRAWSTNAWRGGFRGATVWDELDPLQPLADAAESRGSDAALLLAADWCAVDPDLCAALIDRHAETPDAMPLCFSQAPPGLSGLVVASRLLRDLAQADRGFCEILAYNPKRPAVDPISQEFNVAVPAAVRATARRFIYDTPEAIARLRSLHDRLGDEAFVDADAGSLTDHARQIEVDAPQARFTHLPPVLEIELTPRRRACGPVTPQASIDPARNDFALHHFDRLAEDLAGRAVTLGGIGEPLLHPRWPEAIARCRQAGAAAVALQTDLLTDGDQTPDQLAGHILDADPDAVFVRLNAESAETYRQAMGVDRFAFVVEALQAVFAGRAERARTQGLSHACPLIVPTLTKTYDTTPEMEHFFERWWQLADHAVIHRFPQGGRGGRALAADQNPVPMDPPWREPDPWQFKHRLTVLSDGLVCLCHEDWLGRGAIGSLDEDRLHEVWRSFPDFDLPDDWRHDDSPFCPRCFGFASLHAAPSRAAVSV